MTIEQWTRFHSTVFDKTGAFEVYLLGIPENLWLDQCSACYQTVRHTGVDFSRMPDWMQVLWDEVQK